MTPLQKMMLEDSEQTGSTYVKFPKGVSPMDYLMKDLKNNGSVKMRLPEGMTPDYIFKGAKEKKKPTDLTGLASGGLGGGLIGALEVSDIQNERGANLLRNKNLVRFIAQNPKLGKLLGIGGGALLGGALGHGVQTVGKSLMGED